MYIYKTKKKNKGNISLAATPVSSVVGTMQCASKLVINMTV